MALTSGRGRIGLILGSGTSTTTWVDLTEATASTPGSSLSSVAASADINETTRNGPHCRSTWAITVSLTTLVTRPVNRFRALSGTGVPSSGARAISWAWRGEIGAVDGGRAPAGIRLQPA